MRLSDIIFLIKNIKYKSKYLFGFIMQKLNIKRKIEIEIINERIIKEYYNENYNYDDYYLEYNKKEYNGYKVDSISNDMLDGNKDDSNYLIVNYIFGLPLHKEVLNRLNFKINNKKYKLINIMLEMERDKPNNSESIEFYKFFINKDIYLGLNIAFIYNSYIISNKESNITNYEYLLVVDKVELENILNNLKKETIIKKYLLSIDVIEDELIFFKRDKILKQYNSNEYSIHHINHSALVYRLNKDLINYYMLINHLMKIGSFYYISDSINRHFEIEYNNINLDKELDLAEELKIYKYLDEKIKNKKNKIYKKINNIYLKNTYDCFVYINENWINRFKNKFFKKIKEIKLILW